VRLRERPIAPTMKKASGGLNPPATAVTHNAQGGKLSIAHVPRRTGWGQTVPGAVNTPLIGGIDPCRTRPPLFPVWSPSGQLAAVRLMRERRHITDSRPGHPSQASTFHRGHDRQTPRARPRFASQKPTADTRGGEGEDRRHSHFLQGLIMITVAVANRNANTGASTTTPGIVDHMAQIGRLSIA
jgi:hypothetical protein